MRQEFNVELRVRWVGRQHTLQLLADEELLGVCTGEVISSCLRDSDQHKGCGTCRAMPHGVIYCFD